jgi:methionyl aminopeptidase
MKDQVGRNIQCSAKLFEANVFSVVRDFVGHGIGTAMHENPSVPNYGRAGRGIVLRENMTLAVEPMVNMGTYEVEVLDDEWTTVTLDKKYSAHYEHTLLIKKGRCEILTIDD